MNTQRMEQLADEFDGKLPVTWLISATLALGSRRAARAPSSRTRTW
jgi:hypothetical protein